VLLKAKKAKAGNPYLRGWMSTVDLHVLTSLDQLLFENAHIFYLFDKTSYLNEDVNRTPLQLVFLAKAMQKYSVKSQKTG
jgi:hypothetical protein